MKIRVEFEGLVLEVESSSTVDAERAALKILETVLEDEIEESTE